ncbi:hypothetical protein DAD186_04760 [Dermabacter vaginalis]|uniref:DUF4229 domain-containing protein n=1 Tax=Dermabacter vaginalis TaxID=1630135 RepID=A0A1B0ZGF7_9MICO|nr:DUF4229 domain-containing protein [Dermabacter vaginalis]ANP27031.1 hypothetical protein DAD186_04760 [Dermabacter vaginalis]
MRNYVLYSIIRLALFAGVWALLYFLMPGVHWFFTGILAAVIAMLISILALGELRQGVAANLEHSVEARRDKRRDLKTEAELDAEAEDSLLDRGE